MLRERLKQLAAEYPRYGYELLHGMLKAEGLVVNEKKTYRIYREEKLQVRRKRRKRLLARDRVPMPIPEGANQRWSMDFVSDQLATGRRFRVLTNRSLNDPVGLLDSSLKYILLIRRAWVSHLLVTKGVLPSPMAANCSPAPMLCRFFRG